MRISITQPHLHKCKMHSNFDFSEHKLSPAIDNYVVVYSMSTSTHAFQLYVNSCFAPCQPVGLQCMHAQKLLCYICSHQIVSNPTLRPDKAPRQIVRAVQLHQFQNRTAANVLKWAPILSHALRLRSGAQLCCLTSKASQRCPTAAVGQ